MTDPDEQRYEFRVWGEDLGGVEELIRTAGEPGDVRTSSETYLVTPSVDDVNVKARSELLDIKTRVEIRDGFERWSVHLKEEFPVPAALVAGEVYRLLRLDPPVLDRGSYSLASLVSDVVEHSADLHAVAVTKRRDQFEVEGCAAEVAAVTIGPLATHTVAIESTDLAALRRLRMSLGLDAWENVSYPKAIHATLRDQPAG